MFNLHPKSNIANKIRNTKLPRTKPLIPLFELISNSIHAINELEKTNNEGIAGLIKIRLIRGGEETLLENLTDIDEYPVNSIFITDNGAGLNDENLNSFIETDTDCKSQSP